ncbi:MAG TPA: alpha/beta fold hydrolase [Gemmatimonadales bacterium]|jgi:dienelactone hydrolase
MATPTLSKHSLPGALGPLLIDVRSSDRASPRPAVVIVHGFKGFKDWGMFPALAERVARAGFAAVSVNLSGSGVDDHGRFAFPERFGHNTFSAELADIGRVLSALGEARLELPPTSQVGLVGHSRGGGMAILAASRDPRVHALVTWSAISTVDRWPGQGAEWRKKGRLDVTNTRTGEVLPLYTDVLDDVEGRGKELDIRDAARRLAIPWLLLHGGDDASVPVEEARALAEAAAPSHPPRVIILPGAGHTFGAVHPFAGMTPDLAMAFDETLKWFGRHL